MKLRKFIVGFTILLLFGCYEGMPVEGEGPRKSADSKKRKEAPKPIGYTLVHFITPSQSAIKTDACGSDSYYRGKTLPIWSKRIDLIVEMLNSISDKVVIKEVAVDQKPCSEKLEPIRNAALNATPWDGIDEAPSQKTSAQSKPVLHFKVVLWDEDLLIRCPSVVKRPFWEFSHFLSSIGLCDVSLFHFINKPGQGYFNEWITNLDPKYYFLGNYLDPIAEQTLTIESKTIFSKIKQDTEDLKKWVLNSSREQAALCGF